jgi:hypothetical protein
VLLFLEGDRLVRKVFVDVTFIRSDESLGLTPAARQRIGAGNLIYNSSKPFSIMEHFLRSLVLKAKAGSIRRHRLAEEPRCRECSIEGRTVPASHVDHIEPHKGEWSLFNEKAASASGVIPPRSGGSQ